MNKPFPPAAVTAARLQLFAPRCDYLALAPHLERARLAAGILAVREVRHWLAQLHHESRGFTRFEEDLAWKTPERLDAYFLSVKGAADAAALIRRGPAAIANRVYAGKNGNGDEASGDGWRYRGRGLIQLTGRKNYREAGGWLGLDLEASPELAARPDVAALVAAWWWVKRGLSQVVAPDAGERAMADIRAHVDANELDDCRQARRIINGGENGLEDAIHQLRRAATVWRD